MRTTEKKAAETQRGFPGGLLTSSPPRTYLYYVAVFVELGASAVSGVGFVLEDSHYFLGGTVLWAVWFVLMFMVTRPSSDEWLRPQSKFLHRIAAVIFIFLFVVGVAELIGMAGLYPRLIRHERTGGEFVEVLQGLNTVFEYNDSTILVQQASENLLKGDNPYAHANIIEGLIQFEGAPDRVTPLRQGRFADIFPYPALHQLELLFQDAVQDPANPPVELESRFCYPAGAFLLPAPFIAMGMDDLRWILAGFALAGLAYALWRIPRAGNKLLFLGGALISLEFWNSVGAGETSMLVFPLLMVAWLSLDRNRWVSLAFMGLAIATKQTAWFILPFYLIFFLKTYGWRQITAGIGIMVAVFVALNLPFAIADFKLWLDSVISPMADPMFPLGVGIITLVTSGLVDIQSTIPFTIMEAAAGVLALVWYYRNCRKYPHVALVLAVLPIFFAWRSLWTYFYYVGLISFAGVLSGASERREELPVSITEKQANGPASVQ